jgi:nucleoside 2-deoxyribosyltransferase
MKKYGRDNMKIYIASSLRNCSLNNEIDKILKKAGFITFLPQRDSKISSKRKQIKDTPKLASTIFSTNIKGIDESDLILVVSLNLGTDTAWECGYAFGKQKKIILLAADYDSIWKMYMVIGAGNIHHIDFFNENSYRSSIRELSIKINKTFLLERENAKNKTQDI